MANATCVLVVGILSQVHCAAMPPLPITPWLQRDKYMALRSLHRSVEIGIAGIIG